MSPEVSFPCIFSATTARKYLTQKHGVGTANHPTLGGLHTLQAFHSVSMTVGFKSSNQCTTLSFFLFFSRDDRLKRSTFFLDHCRVEAAELATAQAQHAVQEIVQRAL